MSADAPRRLGRGLEALISASKQLRTPDSGDGEQHHTTATSDLRRVRLADIAPNRFQPRRSFSEPELAELEASIGVSGLLQPITVRSQPGGGFELVAGERRMRAAGRLGWTEIPAIVRNFDDREMLTLALVENLQRADLNPLDEARGYQRLIGEFGLTQHQVAEAVGKDRTTVTNLLRVLSLPASVQAMLEQGHITAGHARALLPIKDERRQLELANEILVRQLSVREVEGRARAIATGRESPLRARPDSAQSPASSRLANTDPAVRQIEEQLRKRLQTDVQVQPLGNDRGVVRISYYSGDDLERVLDLIVGERTDFGA
ncbi:MAG: ParB/RepB/Spo0J family partition protein [Gemmatimonadaceae bacterium]